MAVVALKQKPKGPSFGEALAQTAKTAEPKAKKSKMPTLQPTPDVAQAVDDYQEAKIQYKMAEATMDQAGTILQEFVRQHQDEDGFRGHYQGSYAVMGIKHQAKVVYANKFTINPEDDSQLGDEETVSLTHQYQDRFKEAFDGLITRDEIEGLVIKNLQGRLNLGRTRATDSTWMWKVRKPSNRYHF